MNWDFILTFVVTMFIFPFFFIVLLAIHHNFWERKEVFRFGLVRKFNAEVNPTSDLDKRFQEILKETGDE